ncbi:hypothetical protein WN51_14118 [Melipona quadrifasciata]|uniref:Uncharacterized protein n=1 Tax=Melipona quadrifasciata TaxID=166423 RepID=A0A0N0BFZ1_9HYME|nr:hypothetical protein WN51_14118 [Melipona quadrifasciata]
METVGSLLAKFGRCETQVRRVTGDDEKHKASNLLDCSPDSRLWREKGVVDDASMSRFLPVSDRCTCGKRINPEYTLSEIRVLRETNNNNASNVDSLTRSEYFKSMYSPNPSPKTCPIANQQLAVQAPWRVLGSRSRAQRSMGNGRERQREGATSQPASQPVSGAALSPVPGNSKCTVHIAPLQYAVVLKYLERRKKYRLPLDEERCNQEQGSKIKDNKINLINTALFRRKLGSKNADASLYEMDTFACYSFEQAFETDAHLDYLGAFGWHENFEKARGNLYILDIQKSRLVGARILAVLPHSAFFNVADQ